MMKYGRNKRKVKNFSKGCGTWKKSERKERIDENRIDRTCYQVADENS